MYIRCDNVLQDELCCCEDGDSELTLGRPCSGKHVIEVIGYVKQRDGDCETEKQ